MKRESTAILMALLLFSVFTPIMSIKADGSVPLGGFWHFDEGAETTAYDSSGNSNTGIVCGGATWADGKYGKALCFDGANDYVEAPDSNSLDITGKIALEAWIYPYTVTKMQVIVQKYNYSGPPYNGAYYLGVGGYGYNNKVLFGLSHNGYNFYYILSNTNITANTWTHVAATSNGTHMIMYINGIKDRVATYSPGVIYASAAPLRIGCFQPELGVSRFFDGVIDEVRVSSGTIWTVDDDRVQCPNADFTNIQAAVNIAGPDDTIIVHDGTYNENLVVNKALTIKAASKPIIDGGAAGDCISVSANNVFISGFEIRNGYNGISGQTSGSTFSNNIIHDNLNILGSAGVGILLWGDNDNNIITGSEIYNNDRQGIFIGYQDDSKISTGNVIENNVIYNNGLYRYANGPDASAYGIQLWCADYNLIKNNEIYLHDDWFAYPEFDFAQGIYLCDANGNTVVGNYLHDNNYGVGLWHPARSIGNNYVNYNNMAGNAGYGVCTFDGLPAADGRFNWWGDASGPTHSSNPGGMGDEISDNVDYSPWLGATYDSTPRTYHVNPTGTIQEAIDEASAGGTILVHDGTYRERLIIDKSLKVKAASNPIIEAPDAISRKTYTFPESSATWDPIVFAYGGTMALSGAVSGSDTIEVTFEGFEIDGRNTAVSPARFVGILYRNVKSGVISSNIIHDMYDVDGQGNGPQTFGILVYGDSDVTVKYNEVSDFSRGGIGVQGDDGALPDPVATVEWNTIVGNGLEAGSGWWAENGIQMGYGAGGSIIENNVTSCKVNSPAWVSTGILVIEAAQGVNILRNNVSDCDTGIAVSTADSPSLGVVDGNIVTGCTWDAIRLGLDGLADHVTVSNNIISNSMMGIGVWDSSYNTIKNNLIREDEYGIIIDGNSNNNEVNQNDILDNTADGIVIEPYGGFDPSGTQIHYNNIVGNGGYGVLNTGMDIANATYNWWGDFSGPCHGTSWMYNGEPYGPHCGLGDNVSDYVLYYPWTLMQQAVMKVEPPVYHAKALNETFTVNITLSNVTNEMRLVGFEFKLHYNTTLLEIVEIENGTFFEAFAGPPNGGMLYYGPIRKQDYVLFAGLILPDDNGIWYAPFPSGNGTLATITFRVKYQPMGIENSILSCNLTLSGTTLGDTAANGIPHQTENGRYDIVPTPIGDLNFDGEINILDAIVFSNSFGTSSGDPRYDPLADINHDGSLDILDAIIIGNHFGEERPDP